MRALLLIAALTIPAIAAASAASPGTGGAHRATHGAQAETGLKSLSPEDVAELRRGGGWGLAKPAELNGVPGPRHLLELKRELGLSGAQQLAITRIFEDMQARAIEKGRQLIALEAALEHRFRMRSITEDSLQLALGEIAAVRSELRYIHLSAHLKTPPILSPRQIRAYRHLRGHDGHH